MAENNIAPSSAKKGRRWLRWLTWAAAIVVVLLVVVYFTVTSSAFLKSMILPRVGAMLDSDVTVADASIHPFSGLSLTDLKVQPHGQAPLVTAQEVRVSYHLFDIIGGNIHVDAIALVSPTVQLVQNPDGSSNLGTLLKALQSKPAAEQKPATTTKAAKPLQIDVGALSLSDATVVQIKKYADGRSDSTGVTNLNITLSNLKNGQTAKLDVNANVRIDNQENGDRLAAALKGSFNCSLDANLKPGTAGGSLSFDVSDAAGTFAQFNTFSAGLDANLTPTEIKKLALHFEKAGEPLGQLAVTGPFDATKMEGKLDVELQGVDHRLLNLAAAKGGLDFGTTTIDSTNEIELASGGKSISVAGAFNVNKMQVTRAGQTTPVMDLNMGYDVAVDTANRNCTLRGLNLDGKENGAPLLSAQLTSPMSLSWGGTAGMVGDSALNLAVTSLNLADWRPFLGNTIDTGTVDVKLKVSSQQGGTQVGLDLTTALNNLSASAGGKQISGAGVSLEAHGQVAQLKQISLDSYKLQVALKGQPAVTVSGTASYNVGTGDADAQVQLQAMLARLIQALPQPNMSISSGDVAMNLHVTQKQKVQTVTGSLSLTNFDGQISKNALQSLGAVIKLDVANSPEQIGINQVAGSLSQNGKAAGDFDLSGTYKPAQKAADVKVKLADLNQNLLRPFLEPALGGKKLTSVSINGVLAAQYDPQAGAAVMTDMQVTNLVVNDPKQQFPATPLAVGLKTDASFNQQKVATVRQLQIALTPTALATNQINFSGEVNLANASAIQGQLKLAADSLDLTRYYDLFMGGTNAAVAKAKAPAPAPATAPSNQEPPAVKLPLQNFTAAVEIGRMYLHEVAISNLETTVKIDGGHVVLKPCQLMLNGAPVAATADLDLSVPGYKYNVTFNANGVPLAPLVDTFQPARVGQMGGVLMADAQINGAGVTGASLQKNLTGQFNLDMTNLNLSVVNVQSPLLKGVINVVAAIPELFSNPAGALTSLLSGVTGQGGLMQDLQQSPLEYISMKINAGNGQVNLQQALVQSSAFEANAAGGTVTLDSVLTNSTLNIPVSVSLGQAIAKKLSITTAPAGGYVPLPQFLSMTGTLGSPKSNVDKMALAGAAVKGVGSKLFGPSGTTNTSPVKGLINGLFKLGK